MKISLKQKTGLLGSDVLLCGAFAAAPSPPPKPSPIEGVREEGVPTIFLYPDFPRLATLINDKGENVLVKHLGEGAKYFAGLHNWDQLATVVQTEIVEGRGVYVDFSETKSTDWAPDSPDSLTGTFLSKCVPTFMNTPVKIAPSSHYTIGGLKIDVDGRTNLPNVYAAGEVAGGVHGANRHGGTALVDAITFGRIAGQHAARNLAGKSAGRSTSLSAALSQNRKGSSGR